VKPKDFVEEWVSKKYPIKPRDQNWYKLKTRICKAGEQLNPLLFSKGGEIEIEQFGIVGSLFKVKDKTFPEKDNYFYQCPLIEARETGTGKFGEWLQNVKGYVERELRSKLALCNITNQNLYKYCEQCDVPVAVDGVLYKVAIKQKGEMKGIER
jgi:hypothetical protein